MTSFQFWVGGIAATGSDWGFHTFCTFGPKYIKSALGFDLEQVNIIIKHGFFHHFFSLK